VSNKALRILGYIEWNASGLATAGNWDLTNFYYAQVFGPGIRKPGDIVQTNGFSGALAATVSASFVDVTSATITVTPKSAANKFLFMCGGVVQASAAGAGTNSEHYGQFLRGATILATSLVGVVSGAGSNMQTDGSIVYSGVDTPNTLAAVTYKMQHRGLSASHNVSSTVRGYVQEIMG